VSKLRPCAVIGVFVVTAVSCSSSPTQTTEVSASSPQTDGSTFPTPSSTPETFTADLTFGSGPFTLTQTTTGLGALTGYSATLSVSFDGTRHGQPSTWTKTYTRQTNATPATVQLTVDSTGDLTDLDRGVQIEAAGVSYDKRGDAPCTATETVDGGPPAELFQPATALTSVIGADSAGPDTVDGTATTRYTFDEKALGLDGQATSVGALWVAATGGYVVKYNLTTTAKAEYFGAGVEGTVTFSYALTGANQPATIAVPADCPPGLVDVQPLQDASEVTTMPGLLSFTTATSAADAAAFYQNEIPQSGWTQTADPAISDTSTELDFAQGSTTLTVLISSEGGTTSVDILLGNTTS
jgi:hypothetical protein